MEQRQLGWFIPTRSEVRVLPPLPRVGKLVSRSVFQLVSVAGQAAGVGPGARRMLHGSGDKARRAALGK